MTTQATPPVPAEALAAPPPAATRETRKFTVAEYYRVAEVGILGSEERVELVEGEIIVMPLIGPGHAWDVDIISNHLARSSEGRFIVRTQNPMHSDDAGSDFNRQTGED